MPPAEILSDGVSGRLWPAARKSFASLFQAPPPSKESVKVAHASLSTSVSSRQPGRPNPCRPSRSEKIGCKPTKTGQLANSCLTIRACLSSHLVANFGYVCSASRHSKHVLMVSSVAPKAPTGQETLGITPTLISARANWEQHHKVCLPVHTHVRVCFYYRIVGDN